MIEREAMAGDPSRDSDTDRGKFSLADPHAREAGTSPGGDVVVRGGAYEHLLEIADVAVHIAAIRFQIEDGVADDLSRPVVGNVASTARFEHFDAARGKRFWRRQDVGPSSVATDAQSQDGRVFDKEQLIRNGVDQSLFDELTL